MGKRKIIDRTDSSVDLEFWFEDPSIMSYLREVKREDILFNYDNLETLEELQLFCKYLLNQSVLGIGTEQKSRDRIRFTTPIEKQQSLKAIAEKTTNIKADDVLYTVSDLGFRLDNPLDFITKGVSVFGCSITYGIGIPTEKTFCGQLQKLIELPVYNFGVPGAGIQKITKAFIALNNQFKLKTAIFVLPSMHRFELIGLDEFDELFTESYVPNFTPINPSRQAIYDLAYTHFDDIHFLNETVKHTAMIKANAKANGTEVHFLTWDANLRNLASDYKVKDLTKYKIVNFIEIQEKVQGLRVTDFARDGLHPGLRSHTNIANYLYHAIFKRKLGEDRFKPRSGKKII